MATKKRKNRHQKYILSVIATVAVLALIYLFTYLLKQSINSVSQDLDGPYDVVSVIDGDTIIVKIDDGDVHVRLIGIDTPESVASDGYKENTPEGDKASEYTQNLLEGNSVYLEYDKELTDSYQRTLAYVYLPDGSTMVNELLIQNGYARTMEIAPNTKYAERFAAQELIAKGQKAGFWGTGFFNEKDGNSN